MIGVDETCSERSSSFVEVSHDDGSVRSSSFVEVSHDEVEHQRQPHQSSSQAAVNLPRAGVTII